MRVAVLGKCQYSMFSGSQANATLAVAELLRVQGHDTYILSHNEGQVWWDDVKELEGDWKGHVFAYRDALARGESFDLMLEVGHILENGDERKKITKKSVVVMRKHTVLEEIEHSLFPTSSTKRCWDGVSEVWAFDMMVNSDDIQMLETISRLPVYKVPYVWTPAILEKHRNEMKSPLWIQMATQWLEQEKKEFSPWSVHVAETNTTSASSCTLPLLIVRELYNKKEVPISRLRIHNSEHVFRSKFFQDNVWRHARVDDLSGEFLGRQRVPDWVYEPMSVCIAHSRFNAMRPMLLDMAWVGIPFVHNSPVMRDLGLSRYYYSDNRISEAMDAMKNLQDDFKSRSGCFSIEGLNGGRKNILERISPYTNVVQESWKAAIERVMSGSAPVVVPAPVVAAAPAPAPAPAAAPAKKSKVTIGFSDMWDSFQPSYNFFTLMLQEAGRQFNPPIEVEGVDIRPGSATPDVLLFGPFGQTWTLYPSVPKIHFTGENTRPVTGDNVKLNLGFAHADMIEETYLRFPLWILEIDWFGADPERIVNPKPIPIDRCTKLDAEEVDKKKKFCAFVVSNPNNPLRNAAFQWLNSYKSIDSAGRLFNNMGDILAAGPGGGGGELKKLDFLKDYKFALTYENSSSQGYVTEKILHAKAAGCVPIYWGDPKINRDFNTKGFISAQDIKTPEELIEVVRNIDTNQELWREMALTPALDEYKVEWTRRTMAELSRRILKMVLSEEQMKQMPRFIGARTTLEAAAMRGRSMKTSNTVEPPVLVTFVTRRFLPSLQLWLTALSAQRKAVPVTARIYYGEDVPIESIEKMTGNFDFISVHPVPKESPDGFSDFWEPQHFAWKLWLYKTLASDADLAGRMVLYLDAGCFMCRWPTAWLLKAQKEDICFLEDPRQKNDQWCHEVFCKALEVTDSEKAAQQIVAGILVFRAGAPRICALMEEAYKWACKRDVIVGPKFQGAMPDGRPRGHRHDQSILSVLRLRYGCATYPLDMVYCDTSLRRTYQTQRAIYCHRGNFHLNVPFTAGIDDCYIINLDRRTDRLERLYKTTPELEERANKISAVEGRKLSLTPELARLFKPHDFFWKKAIMGCALSHLTLWYKLATEHPEIKSFLILEDDVKLSPEWEARWLEARGDLPEGWDIVYLGGILPPNRAGFEHCKERVNKYFSRVGENNFFGQNPPNRYFHWCAYAYVLSRSGAEKVMRLIQQHGGYWTSADHMLCNHTDIMNMYFLDPLCAGCYQDDDPKYQASAFNDFSRIDGFDSDLWNNDERFTAEEVEKALAASSENLEIGDVLKQVQAQQQQAVVAPAPAAVPINPDLAPKLFTQPPQPFKHRFVCIKRHNLDFHSLYEKDWLIELFGKPTMMPVEKVEIGWLPEASETPIVLVQRPYIAEYTAMLDHWSSAGRKFYVLHVSDEHGTDDLTLYTFSGCLKVIRMYSRPDFTDEMRAKIIQIPLGYHWTLSGGGCRSPLDLTPRLPFRSTVWSFFGTGWNGRAEKMELLKGLGRNRCKIYEGWNSPDQLGRSEYIATLLDTVFVPCPGGNNPETFRFYEALECGCLPILVKEGGDEKYHEYIYENLQLLVVSKWEEVPTMIQQLWNDKPTLELYRTHILTKWREWKEKLKFQIKSDLQI